ncbi:MULTISPECIES: hypothetical protein [unclassified Flavobacterium]|uniref:hypothetical protein n=1 Tax=unclassified Flavobacterium TaxID=196869 RepID=UPI003F8E184A
MKVAFKKIVTSLCMLLVMVLYAEPQPPAPANMAAADDGPQPPPGLPIDENIFVLFFMAILFGIYITYKYNSKQKTSV